MALKQSSYKDEEGRLKAVLLPDDEIEEEAAKGIPIGPPSLEELELPLEIEVRLNNELFHRGILTSNDAVRNRAGIQAAIQSALKVDTERVFIAYVGKEFRSGPKESAKEFSDKTIYNRRSRQPRKQTNLSESG